MKATTLLALVLLAAPAAGDKPWEARVDLPIEVPVELPTVPAANPFASAVAAPAAVGSTPMREKMQAVFTVAAVAYVDRGGTCRKVVATSLPLPGIAANVKEALLETTFSAGSAVGAKQATWLPVEIDLSGRIKRGRVAGIRSVPPDPSVPPSPEVTPAPVATASDLALPAVPVETLDVLPAPRRFRMRMGGRELRLGFHLLAHVSEAGRCQKVVFLQCPDGLRAWLLSSLGGWTFQPAMGEAGSVAAWVELSGQLEVELASLSAGSLRILKESSFPGGAEEPAADSPPGG